MKQDKKKIIGLFFVFIIIYGFIASFFTATVHIVADEELYVGLAKSFFYNRNFVYDGEIVTYNNVLYSMLISLAYLFYSPERILFIQRLIGVIMMCSAIFPIWLLAAKVLENRKQAIYISILMMFMPYMFDTSYLMQEVLSYPLFCWTVYFLYLVNEESEKYKKRAIFLSAVFSVLCFFCKSHLFFIPFIVNVLFFFKMFRNHKIKVLKIAILYDGTYGILTLILSFLVLAMNDFTQGNNRYADQFSHLFPITGMTVVCAIFLSVFCIVLFFLSTGILPMSVILFNRREVTGSRRWLLDFTLLSFVALVFETVILSTIPEEGLQFFPHRFLFRYFFMLVPLIAILFVKLIQNKEIFKERRMWTFAEIIVIMCIIYFILIKGNSTQGIVDGYVFLFLINISKYILPYGDALFVAFMGLAFLIMFLLNKKEKNCLRLVYCSSVIMVLFLWLINCVQLPVYNNVIAGGNQIQSDSIKIANYLNEENYDYVYFVRPESRERYVQNFYGYIKQQYQVIDKYEISAAANISKKTAILCSTEEEIQVQGLQRINLETEKLDLYIVKEN